MPASLPALLRPFPTCPSPRHFMADEGPSSLPVRSGIAGVAKAGQYVPDLLSTTSERDMADLPTLRHVRFSHEGVLAADMAAALGLIVFYQWRARHLAEEDPAAYQRLQRIKAALQAARQED